MAETVKEKLNIAGNSKLDDNNDDIKKFETVNENTEKNDVSTN